MGAVDGSDGVTIGTENLPEHDHDLKSPTGQQFYAHREVDGRGDLPDGTSGSSLQTGAENLSQRLSNSGGVVIPADATYSTVGAEMNIMNPFQTINYIIYTGVVG